MEKNVDRKTITIKSIVDSLRDLARLSSNVAHGTKTLAQEITCYSPVKEDGKGFGEPQNYLQSMADCVEIIKSNLEDTREAGQRISGTFELGDPYTEEGPDGGKPILE